MGVFFILYPYFFQGIWGCTIDETGPVILLSPFPFPVHTLFFSFLSFSLFLESLEWIYHLRKSLALPQGVVMRLQSRAKKIGSGWSRSI